jgi:hypothetical protein
MRLKVDFCQCQSHDARSIHEGAWGIPGRLFDSRRMSLGMTKRWRSLYRRWYKKSSGRASIVIGELSVLGKLRFCHIYLCTLFSAPRSNHRCQRLIPFTSPHQPAKSLRFHQDNIFIIATTSTSIMTSTATITPSFPPGSLKSAFAKLDDDLFNSLAASQPGSPSLGATKLSSQLPDTSSHPMSLLQQQQPQQNHHQTPTSAPNPSISKPKASEAVLALLTTPNMTADSIAPLITSDAMLLCPHW